mgnify:CR=1 FL=1
MKKKKIFFISMIVVFCIIVILHLIYAGLYIALEYWRDIVFSAPIIGNSPYYPIYNNVSKVVTCFQEILRILDVPLIIVNIFLVQTYFYLLGKYPNDKQKEHKQRLSNKMQRLSDEYLKTQDELNKLNGEGKSE